MLTPNITTQIPTKLPQKRLQTNSNLQNASCVPLHNQGYVTY